MDVGRKILDVAVAELGAKEYPPNSNRVKYNEWFYGYNVSGPAYPWCMAFVQWCYAQAGVPLPVRTASCGELLRWYKANQPECVTDDPVPGCIVIFDFPGTKYSTDHTGIFESAGSRYVTTIDGNTGSTSDSDGGEVMRRSRPVSNVAAYIVPLALRKEEDSDMEERRYNTLVEISEGAPWATETVAKLIERDIIRGNGVKDKHGRPADMDLSTDMLRLLVWNDRAGLYV